LARVLATTHWTKTMEKEDRVSAKIAASNIPQTITRLYWNGQLLQGYVATPTAHHSQPEQVYPRRVRNLLHFNGGWKCKKSFDQMKLLMAADVLCAYPHHNKHFQIFTDASDYQLGA
jgi:hypothetical protein